MKLETGQRGECRTCGESIYFSQARIPEDPWVHSLWTRREYDHPAVPKDRTTEMVVVVRSHPLTDEEAKGAVVRALRAAGFINASVMVVDKNEYGLTRLADTGAFKARQEQVQRAMEGGN